MAKTRTAPKQDDEFPLRNRIAGLEYVLPSELSMHPKNWRLHPEAQRSALSASLEKIGIADASLAYRSERNAGALTLIDGHLRRDLVEQPMPVLVLDLNDDEADLLLASHDVLTTMAKRDEQMLSSLIGDIETQIPRDLLIAIDPDLPGWDFDFEKLAAEAADAQDKPRYPIVPEFDEGYDSVIVFATSETDWAWIERTLDLPRVQDRSRVGTSHVLTVKQFRERWDKR